MTTFVRYDDEVEVDVTGLTASAWTTVDLAPYLVDTSAIGVVMRMTLDVTGQPTLNGFTEAGDGLVNGQSQSIKLFKEHYFTSAVSLAGATSIDIRVQLPASIRAYVSGEIHDDDGAVLYDHAIHQTLVDLEHGSWVDRQPTPQGTDVMADIGAVIVRQASQGGTGGVRQKGSTDPTMVQRREGGSAWNVVGVDASGYYQINSTGKAGFDPSDINFYEIGYIKKTSGVVTILNPVDEGLAARAGSFGTLDLSGSVPVDTLVVGGRIKAPPGGPSFSRIGYLRNTGSSEGSGMIVAGGGFQTQMVALDVNRQAEYQFEDATVDLYLTWYEIEIPVVVTAGVGTADTFVGSSVKTYTYAGPAVVAGTVVSAAIGAAPHAGPATDAGAALRSSTRAATHIGPVGDEE